MTLIEFPGNQQKVFAIDPARVTAVAPYQATLPTRGAQLFDMSVIWIDDHTCFISSWSVDHVLQVLNAARAPLAKAFEAGWKAGWKTYPSAVGNSFGQAPSIEDAFTQWCGSERS